MEGDTIRPNKANDLDRERYVYATPNLSEALPYLAKNGTRVVNVALPDSQDFITILPDREEFLKNKKFGGTVYQFSAEGFEQHPRKGSQWVSREGVKVSAENVFDRITSMEGAMQHGLHILFTTKPFTPENYAFMDSITKAPDFPNNLPRLVADGTLIYENAVRGVNLSPFLAAGMPKVDPQAAYKSRFLALPDETSARSSTSDGSQYRGQMRMGRGAAAAGIALSSASGDYTQAATEAAMVAGLDPVTYKAAAALTQSTKGVALALETVGKKIPVVGAVVTAGFVGWEIGTYLYEGRFGKAAAAVPAGIAESLGNVFGPLGVGDAARQAVVEVTKVSVGEQYAPRDAGLVSLGKGAVDLATGKNNMEKKPLLKPSV